jgi:hypothetical protein
MQGSAFDELAFYQAIAASGARALLIGRQALVALGMPIMTSDYDFWLDMNDIVMFNEAVRPFDLVPTRSPDEARANGRYVLENDEHVDVVVARTIGTVDGIAVHFADVWERRVIQDLGNATSVAIPCVDDLILTKRFAARPRDADDIRWLERLRGAR